MERIDRLVTAIVDEKPVDAEQLFKDEMSGRIKTALTKRKLEIGQELFASKPNPTRSQLSKLIDPEE